MKFNQNSKVLVTGAGGFIGTRLAQKLTDCNSRILSLVQNKKKANYPAIVDYDSSPLEQFHAGIGGQNTWCKDNLFLILKNDNTPNLTYDNHSACVIKPTLEKLVQREWGFALEENHATGYLGDK